MLEFPGAPEYNTINYFVIVLFFSIACIPLSFLSRNYVFQKFLHLVLGALCLFAVAPRLMFAYLLFWIVVYLFAEVVRIPREGVLGYIKVTIPVLVVLTPMIVWKLDKIGFEKLLNVGVSNTLWTYWRPMGEIDATYYLVAPLGLSFAVFRAIDLIVGVNVGTIPKPNIIGVLGYGFFAPVQIVGPIIQYKEIDSTVAGIPERIALIRWGAAQIFLGMMKAFVLGWPLAWSASIFGLYASQDVLVIWLAIVIFPVYLYLNFAGFSDISIGFAALYGYRLDPNFNNPLLRTSLQQFWNNWHMSLTRFAQRNIFVPLGGYRKQTQLFAVFCTMMTIALWHDLSIALALFGTLHGTALILGRKLGSVSNAIQRTIAPPSSPLHWLPTLGGWGGMYLFLLMTAPLLMLHDADILPFYASLAGLGR